MCIGHWKDDVRSGQGTYTYSNGDIYDGNWSNNLRHGMGTYTYIASSVKYEGGWVNGKKEGTGELVFANYIYKGHFSGDQVRCWYVVHVTHYCFALSFS